MTSYIASNPSANHSTSRENARLWPPRPPAVPIAHALKLGSKGGKSKWRNIAVLPELKVCVEDIIVHSSGDIELRNLTIRGRFLKECLCKTRKRDSFKKLISHNKTTLFHPPIMNDEQKLLRRKAKFRWSKIEKPCTRPLLNIVEKFGNIRSDYRKEMWHRDHRATLHFPEAIVDRDDISWGPTLKILGQTADKMLKHSELWLPKNHKGLTDYFTLTHRSGGRLVIKPDQTVNILQNHFSSGRRIWITCFKGDLMEIDICAMEDFENSRSLFNSTGDDILILKLCEGKGIGRNDNIMLKAHNIGQTIKPLIMELVQESENEAVRVAESWERFIRSLPVGATSSNPEEKLMDETGQIPKRIQEMLLEVGSWPKVILRKCFSNTSSLPPPASNTGIRESNLKFQPSSEQVELEKPPIFPANQAKEIGNGVIKEAVGICPEIPWLPDISQHHQIMEALQERLSERESATIHIEYVPLLMSKQQATRKAIRKHIRKGKKPISSESGGKGAEEQELKDIRCGSFHIICHTCFTYGSTSTHSAECTSLPVEVAHLLMTAAPIPPPSQTAVRSPITARKRSSERTLASLQFQNILERTLKEFDEYRALQLLERVQNYVGVLFVRGSTHLQPPNTLATANDPWGKQLQEAIDARALRERKQHIKGHETNRLQELASFIKSHEALIIKYSDMPWCEAFTLHYYGDGSKLDHILHDIQETESLYQDAHEQQDSEQPGANIFNGLSVEELELAHPQEDELICKAIRPEEEQIAASGSFCSRKTLLSRDSGYGSCSHPTDYGRLSEKSGEWAYSLDEVTERI
ncbi:hypothetical protein BGZ60DRAFT_428140 [Tricladium varicosporioides]|nr:hypothetical protein BGZ60DRAFT_428140 [Hymenoscyphus varicosporioides]